MSAARVLLARHPETTANSERRYVGSGDTPLTERGHTQAARLARTLAEWSPDAVLTSPSPRCADVAADVAGRVGLDLRVVEELAEMDFGLAEGMTYEEVARAGISLDLLGGPDASAVFEGGEPWDVFAARVAGAAALLEAAGERVAVVTHGGVARALVVHWLGLPDDAAWRFAIPTGATAEVAIEDGFGVLVAMTGADDG